MFGPGGKQAQFGSRKRTQKDRVHALATFLLQCRPEKLATYTAADLAKMHDVPLEKTRAMLRARQGGPA